MRKPPAIEVLGRSDRQLLDLPLNGIFLTPANLTNLGLQMTATGTISLGVIMVLLLGEVDLSVGSVSGLCAVVMTILYVRMGWHRVARRIRGVTGAIARVLVGSRGDSRRPLDSW